MERLCAEVSEIMKNTNWFNSRLLPVSCSVPISSPSMMRLPVVRRVVRVTWGGRAVGIKLKLMLAGGWEGGYQNGRKRGCQSGRKWTIVIFYWPLIVYTFCFMAVC